MKKPIKKQIVPFSLFRCMMKKFIADRIPINKIIPNTNAIFPIAIKPRSKKSNNPNKFETTPIATIAIPIFWKSDKLKGLITSPVLLLLDDEAVE